MVKKEKRKKTNNIALIIKITIIKISDDQFYRYL